MPTILLIQNATGNKNKNSNGVRISKTFLQTALPISAKTYKIETIPASVFTDTIQSTLLVCDKANHLISTQAHSVFVGGDHLSSFGTVLSSLKKYGSQLRLVWMDAHTDIHTEESSPSKNMHGMVVRFLMTHKFKGIPQLHPEQILYIGTRSTEPEEDEFIKMHKIKCITSTDYQDNPEAMDRKIRIFMRDKPVHLSIDVDVLDLKIMSSTGTPVKKGLTLPQISYITTLIRQNTKTHFATDIMEYNPKMGTESQKHISYNTFCKLLQLLH